MGEITQPGESGLPRRGLMRFFSGAALAGALGISLGMDDAEAKKKNKKKGKNKKGNGNKGNGKDKNKGKCKQDGSKCKKSKDCCDSKCQDGRCGDSGRCGTRVDFDTSWGAFGTGNSQFKNPWGISISKDGEVYVTDTDNRRIQVFTEGGQFNRQFGSSGTGSEQFQEPRGIGVNVDNGNKTRVYIADPVQSRIERTLRKFNTTGGLVTELGRNQLPNPRGVAIDINNNVWVVDSSSTGRIFLFDRTGSFVTSWIPSGDGTLSSPEGIAVFKDSDGTWVYITSTGEHKVKKFEYTGNSGNGLSFQKSAGSRGSNSSNFNQPVGIAADSCGNLWVADRVNNRVQILDKDLAFKSRFTANFDLPTGVAVGTNKKSLFVVDSRNNRVQKFSLSG